MDRIDIHVEVVPVAFNELTGDRISEKSEVVRERLIAARRIKDEHFEEGKGMYAIAQMTGRQLRQICILDEQGSKLLKNAMEKLNHSARAYDRILKVARTIADLDSSERINSEHLA